MHASCAEGHMHAVMWGSHDEYQGAWKVATSQGVVFLLNLHTMHQLWILMMLVVVVA